ncbi:MAG: YbjN domain-containing protein [Cyanobacteria bacterium P01_D01_bin.44]
MEKQVIECILDLETSLSQQADRVDYPLQDVAMVDVVIDCCQRNGWQFERLDEDALTMAFQSHDYQWECQLQILEAAKQLIIYSALPVKIPASKQQTAVELVTRLNYGLKIGNFDLDLENLAIYYKTSLDVENAHIDSALINRLFHTNLTTVSKLMPEFVALETT